MGPARCPGDDDVSWPQGRREPLGVDCPVSPAASFRPATINTNPQSKNIAPATDPRTTFPSTRSVKLEPASNTLHTPDAMRLLAKTSFGGDPSTLSRHMRRRPTRHAPTNRTAPNAAIRRSELNPHDHNDQDAIVALVTPRTARFNHGKRRPDSALFSSEALSRAPARRPLLV